MVSAGTPEGDRTGLQNGPLRSGAECIQVRGKLLALPGAPTHFSCYWAPETSRTEYLDPLGLHLQGSLFGHGNMGRWRSGPCVCWFLPCVFGAPGKVWAG